MLKLLFAVAIALSPTLGFSKLVENEDGTSTYIPEIVVGRVPPDQVLVTPKPKDIEPGQIGVGCDTLRGKGLGVIILDKVVIHFVIDCPEQPRRDT